MVDRRREAPGVRPKITSLSTVTGVCVGAATGMARDSNANPNFRPDMDVSQPMLRSELKLLPEIVLRSRGGNTASRGVGLRSKFGSTDPNAFGRTPKAPSFRRLVRMY